jgi:hypothetical protein
MNNEIKIGQFRGDGHMEDVIYEIVQHENGQYKVIYHVLDDDDGEMMINNAVGLKESNDMGMWFDEDVVKKDYIWREVYQNLMPSF